MNPKPLTFKEQLQLFKKRGMIIDNETRAIEKLENIGYYKLKEFAYPLSKVVENENKEQMRVYENVNFNDVITRYYQDKNLRLGLLHAIEKIEVSLKTKISYVLGESYGAFGYLDFSKWCNKEEYCKHYLNYQQNRFKKELFTKIKLSRSLDLKEEKNLNYQGYPSVWLMVDVLMFGDIVHLLTLLSRKNLQRISDYYNCSNKELLSWLKCLNFMRNICAHNSNIVDIKLTTAPVVNDNWKSDIYRFKDGNYSNRLAIVLYIIHHFVRRTNSKYQIYKVSLAIEKIVGKNKRRINQLGFISEESINKLRNL
ncbi:Abi family protein [Staphylococcus sp. IVB6246]|uniref:Abi family protein n=1 Tax=Staphylococcus sp. IVB6246 TaxID=2989772 RepID=UPI0021CF8257|nr:Abi family protein [Staphylococcus sp. IVB6246]UXR69496.1 Abi family protein [Staphylococcus sp. IVB6246]